MMYTSIKKESACFSSNHFNFLQINNQIYQTDDRGWVFTQRPRDRSEQADSLSRLPFLSSYFILRISLHSAPILIYNEAVWLQQSELWGNAGLWLVKSAVPDPYVNTNPHTSITQTQDVNWNLVQFSFFFLRMRFGLIGFIGLTDNSILCTQTE